MFHRRFFSWPLSILGGVVGAGLAVSACSSSDETPGGFGSVVPPGPSNVDAGNIGASDAGAPGPSTTYRIAHLSPDLPSIDFCYRNTTSDAWVGPVLNAGASPPSGGPAADGSAPIDAAADAGAPSADASNADAAPVDATDASAAADATDAAWSDAAAPNDAEAADAAVTDAAAETDASDADASDAGIADAAASDGAAPNALSFMRVTDYASILGSGTFDIGLVAAGSTGCSEPLAVAQVTLNAGKRTTIAIVGRASVDAGAQGALAILAFTDDPSIDEKAARVRFVNAALGNDSRPPAGALIATLRTNGATTPLAADIEPSHAATPTGISPVIDALGYNDAAPVLDPARISLDNRAGAWPSPWAGPMLDLGLRAGSIHTGFIVNGYSSILRVVWCNDTDVAAPVDRCTVLDPSP